MQKEKYKKIVDKNVPKENVGINAVKAFIVGGIMGIIGQGLIDLYTNIFDISTKDAAPFMIITLIYLHIMILII